MNAIGSLTEVNTLATQTALSVWNVASDFLIVLVLLAVLFFFAYYFGRGSFIALLLAFYAAYALYTIFPYVSYLPSTPASMAFFARVALYLVMVAAFSIILRRLITSNFLYIGLFGLVLLALLGAGFLLALGYTVFNLATIYPLSPAIGALFAPKTYFFWWFLGPLVGLIFIAR